MNHTVSGTERKNELERPAGDRRWYRDSEDKKKEMDLGLGGHGDLRRVVPVHYSGVEGRLQGAEACQGVKEQSGSRNRNPLSEGLTTKRAQERDGRVARETQDIAAVMHACVFG